MLVVPLLVSLLEAIMPVLLKLVGDHHTDKTCDEQKEILKDIFHEILNKKEGV